MELVIMKLQMQILREQLLILKLIQALLQDIQLDLTHKTVKIKNLAGNLAYKSLSYESIL